MEGACQSSFPITYISSVTQEGRFSAKSESGGGIGSFSRNKTEQYSYPRECEILYPESNLPSGDSPFVSEMFYSELIPR